MHIDLPIYDTLQPLAFALLSLAIVVNATKEALKMLQGQAADWIGLILKSLLSACVLGAIPTIGRTIVDISSALGNGLLEEAQGPLMDRAFAKAFKSFDCPSGLSITRALFAFLANLALFISLGAKLVIIEIGWPVALHFVLYMGVLSIPASLFGGGGVGGYLKSLLSVSTWPIIFAIVVSAVGGFFGDTFQRVADGKAKLDCRQVQKLREKIKDEKEDPTRYNRDTGTGRFGYTFEKSGMWEVLRFLGVLLVLIVGVFSVPLFGMLAAGETSPGNMLRSMTGGFSSAKKGASSAASGASAVAGSVTSVAKTTGKIGAGGAVVGIEMGSRFAGFAKGGLSGLRRRK